MSYKNIIIHYFLIAYFLFATKSVFSNDIKFTHLSTENGLSNNTVNAILKDSRGFMWFATNNGLNLFDGYHLKTYYNVKEDTTSLSNNIVNCIFEDNNGRIWVGTSGGGACLFDYRTQKFKSYNFDADNENSINSNTVFAIAEGPKGNLWFGTSQGVAVLNKTSNKFKRYISDEQSSNNLVFDYVTDITFDNNDNLWIATYGGGISVLNIETDIFTNLNKENNLLNDNEVWDVFIDSNNKVWIGTANGGINVYDPLTKATKIYNNFPKEKLDLVNTNVVHIIEDIFGKIWFSTDRGGLYRIDSEEKIIPYMHDPTQKESLNSNALTRVYCDEEGVLWVGTYDKGLNKANLNQIEFRHIRNEFFNKNSLSNDNVNAILEDSKGNIWIGTENGLNRTDLDFKSFTHYFSKINSNTQPADNVSLTIMEHKNGEIWIGGYSGGISVLNPRTNTFRYYKNSGKDAASLSCNFIRSIYQDKEGTVWIGTVRNGLEKYLQATNNFQHFPYAWENNVFLNSTNVMDLTVAHGCLYIATYGGGLNIMDLASETFSYYTSIIDDKTSLSDNQAITLFIDSDSSLWVGTNSGLNLFDEKNKTFTHFYQKDGLAGNSIMGILEDNQGFLWISTTDGISKFNKKTKEFINFYKDDGLQDDFFIYNSCTKLSNGHLAFGGVNGLTVFNPKKVKSTRKTPPVIFTDLKLYGKTIIPGADSSGRVLLKDDISKTSEIVLNYNDQLFTIEFSTLTYYSSKQINFIYRLNKDKEWNELGDKNHITFHSLEPGEYQLEIRTSSHDRKSLGEVNSMRIIITPPFWATMWFRFSIITLVILIVFGYFNRRIKNIKKQRKLLEQRVNEKTIELSNANDELQSQKLELEMQNEEISAQRDFTIKQKEEIETQNKELELHRNHLEQLVTERTKELITAKDKAEEADRLKSAFLANMSHEIRTPMNAILGFIELLDEPGLSTDKRTEFKNHISFSGRKLMTLINDLIDISKIEAKQLSISHQKIKLYDSLNTLKNIYQQKALEKNKDIKLLLNVPVEKNLSITSDPVRLSQIFTNLLDNALKFTENGCITLGYKPYNENMLFYVKDTGIGISEQDIKYIFDRFRKIAPIDKKLYPGTGLGLAICKELINLLGGKIWVESEKSKGSDFFFTLPLNS